ncbi:hypothetical protein OG394_15755 [Kribbella sp. NBC_01245]|uniref:hypothetical protein n=1 Tax=Kribbella sp. NBC_01245 TaxID=2903578 RepID=UPI002E2C18D0|nr:hypothetical protein [Kribbella sp. NBC_01245]
MANPVLININSPCNVRAGGSRDPLSHRLAGEGVGYLVLDENSGTWRADLGKLPAGEHLVYSRARIDTTTSAVATSLFTVEPAASVEWQVVSRNAANDPQAWRPATGLKDWSFLLNTTDHGSGPKTIAARMTEHGAETARDTVLVTFR